MKYLCLYENFENANNAYWIINSTDVKEIGDILSKFTYDNKNPYNEVFIPFKRYIQKYFKYGYFLCLFVGYSDYKFDYWVVINDVDYREGKKTYTDDGYEFQGEIKLIDGEIFIDKLMVDVEKYNL
jgi:hypothetical protein